MSDIKEYKCPACGGAMEFDSASQKMKCPYCDTVLEIAVFEEENADLQPQKGKTAQGTQWEAMGGNSWQQEELDGMAVYVCQSCGGEITADKNTGATTCPFCGNRVVMKGQFSGALKPDYIIPFKLDKKAAKEAYHKHLSGKAFVPKVFRQENHIDEIVGLYVPFWLFDVDAEAQIMYDAEKLRIWRSGDTEYTEHDHYQISRAGGIGFEHIPADGSRKMDDALMDSMEPYHFKDAVPFKSAYLAGYVADRYDVEKEECIERAQERIGKSVEDTFRKTVKVFQSVQTASSNLNILDARYWYAMYPVWILNTTWNGNKYVFAMNGQTGKIVGDLPADKGAFWKYVAARGAVIGAIIYALMWILVLI